MKLRTAFVGIIAAAALTGGCGEFSVVPPTPITVSNEFNALWDASLEVLRENNFTVDRADPRQGIITTSPLLGRHWFETWRTDARTKADVTEGTLQTVQRQVTVKIRQGDLLARGAEAGYLADVEAHITRSDRPNVRITNTSEAYELFLDPASLQRATALPENQPEPSEQAKTAPLGRDKHLELYLLQQIQLRAAEKLAVSKR